MTGVNASSRIRIGSGSWPDAMKKGGIGDAPLIRSLVRLESVQTSALMA